MPRETILALFIWNVSIFKPPGAEKAQLSMSSPSSSARPPTSERFWAPQAAAGTTRAAPVPLCAFMELNKTLLATITSVSYLCCSVNNEILIMYSESTKPFPWKLCFHVISLMNR